jgi:hypothetical protein
MDGIDPVVRHMLLCEDVRRDPNRPNKVDILGMIGKVEAAPGASFPIQLPVLCVYLEVTGGRGTGRARIECRHGDSGQLIFSSLTYPVTFPPDPLALRYILFRVRDCRFPEWPSRKRPSRVVGAYPTLKV